MSRSRRLRVAAIGVHFAKLTDPRMERTKLHSLLDMVFITLCATMCGAEGWADVERFGKSKRDWFTRFLSLENGIPSHDTFGRVFARLDTQEFQTCVHNWLLNLGLSLKDQGISIDGKTLRRSFDTATGKSALHVVSAWASQLRICLGQVAVDGKSNEITAVPKLLELLELTGAVVTLDAMHCQKDTTAAIRAKQADYVITVKANQPKLHDALQQFFLDAGNQDYPGVRIHKTTERNRGRVERREVYVAPAPAELTANGEWVDLRSVGMIYRYREDDGKESHAVTFFISSLSPRVKRIARYVRDHWGVENSLHWVLDVTFREDDSRIRKDNSPEIAGIFRRLALSVLQQDTSINSSIRGKRLQAGWNEEILERILCGSTAI
jgi:predicted transposase YbfD/YdcC